jgi:type I restriction enzyme S subunit
MEAIGEKGELDLSAVRDIEDVRTGYTQFFDGDVLIAKITPCFENGKGALVHGTLQGVGFGTTELHVLTPSPEVDGRFLYYITASELFRKLGEASMTGAAGQKRVPEDFVRDFRVPVPPIYQQRAIADYLDRETVWLDGLVAAKERVLELVAEKRRALITCAVTCGLDPRAPLRDSGIPWLGKIPTHWQIIQFKFACSSLQTGPFGSQLHSEDYIEGGIPVINPAHLVGGVIAPDMRVSVDEETAERLSLHRLATGDVIFSRRGELGRCAVVQDNQAGWLCGTGSLRARLNSFLANPEYIALLFGYTAASDWLTLKSVGSTMDNLNTEMLGSFAIVLPSPEEQHAIVTHIAIEMAKLDALRTATERTIALLKERRAALIAAAVTGQIDVEDTACS